MTGSQQRDSSPDPPDPATVLGRFSAPTRAWFEASFAGPTAAQLGAWDAISRREHTLVVAPTGSGKTLSAFLWAIDRIVSGPRPGTPSPSGGRTPTAEGSPSASGDAPAEQRGRCRVLYVSPLKALAVDVERNLRSPLVGIGHAARRLGAAAPEVSVAVRSGDTPAAERRAFAKNGAEILITTPESLFLLLTSQARSALTGVESVIVDEVHAVAGTKRGTHLALTLDRLDHLLERPAQRIGLSATVRPVEEVARYLAGGRPVTTVQPPSTKSWDLEVVVPIPDMADPGAADRPDAPGSEVAARSGTPPPGSADWEHEAQPVEVGEGPVLPELDDDPPSVGAGPVLPDLDGTGADQDEDVWAPAADPEERASIWPHIERRVADLVSGQTSTLVFTNSRRVAERFTSRLNEEWEDRHSRPGEGGHDDHRDHHDDHDDRDRDGDGPGGDGGRHTSRTPAQVMAQSGASGGAAPVLARAHHGSVSKEQRAQIEDALKTGQLPAVVATSSLELGIDMGAVDLVVQVASPPSVASGLQRVGRAGHQVGATSHGVFFPTHRADLVQTAVVVDRMRRGAIEQLAVPTNPLDVLAQQVVAVLAMEDWSVTDLFELVRRSASYAALPRSLFDAVLDMLAGRYPGEDFSDLRPRIVWDRVTDTLSARRGAQLLAVTSGGTIPDRGMYAVMLATGEGPGRRVGELDEEMVYESRVGDVFTLGTTSWRIEDITHDQVLVTPAPGQIGRLPFWKGESLGRPAELGAAVGEFVRRIAGQPREAALGALTEQGLDGFAADNLVTYLGDQREAVGHLPDDRTLVVERFRDEIGDWRVVVHSPWGSPVHAPWALCLAARMRERFGTDVQALAADDGIVLRLPDLGGWDDPEGPGPADDATDGSRSGGPGGARGGGSEAARLDAEIAELLTLDPDEVADLVTQEIGGSALFASRFRECAARALLLPRRNPGKRQPLWQQRQRSAQLLEVAARYPTFPIVLEAVRECVQDVYDVDALRELMRRLAAREVRLVSVVSQRPSPFASSLLMGYIAQFLYEGDSPLAERRAAALSLDAGLLAELLGRGEGAALRDLLDPEVVARTGAELQRLAPDRQARDPEEVVDLLRVLGPLSRLEVAERTTEEGRDHVESWIASLLDSRRVIEVRIAGEQRLADAQDAARLRDALGVAMPVGVPATFLEGVEDPLGDLVVRHARTHTPFTVGSLATRLGLGTAVVRDAVRRQVSSGRLVVGALAPSGTGDEDVCDAEVLRLLRRRSLAALRQEVEPVTQATYARFLPRWQSVGELRGLDGTVRAVEQLAGARIPASALESLVLPARVVDYSPAMLDELMSAGEVLWQGHGSLPGDDGWISLHLADTAHLTMTPAPERSAGAAEEASTDELGETARGVLEVLERVAGGAYFFRALSDAVGSLDDQQLAGTLWELVWTGRVSADTYAPVRALLAGGRTTHKARRAPSRTGRWSRTSVGLAASRGGGASRPGRPTRSGPPATVGRWSLLPAVETDPTVRALAGAEQLLDRYGVLTRGSVVAEGVPGGFAGVYRVLSGAEEVGRVRRGYVVEGLGAAQFGSSGAIDRLRALSHERRPGSSSDGPDAGPEVVLLAATDPASPFGASVPWPERGDDEGSHRPARKAGSMVVLVDGALALYLERGGRRALTMEMPPEAAPDVVWPAAARALVTAVRRGSVSGLTIATIDGGGALSSSHPLAVALAEAGFHTAPQGLRLRR
ncbi:DEAD/DEAH box helicase [Serinicoccus chungangensis]|uniref:DEAD/DEAH box helicase n=1 Tax=Serinicoccus chungangensis TaxID=767452 RepID=A0A0W8IH56_9MICO|nr:DEAD/DEAH box helicase [Serinicoccus chungangensis]KUG59276.1 DEAD/DEAH box helicase [Serinicoccus chungangensis]